MDIFVERSTEPRYIKALDSEPWTTTEFADDQFARTAPDSRLARYAADTGMVTFIRDDDYPCRKPRRERRVRMSPVKTPS
jgi:hypothetical protein